MNPATDLRLTRFVPAPPMALWRCWTEPDLICQWFTPAPVRTLSAVMEPRSGGRFATTMELPDGETIETEGCILAAAPGQLLAFTDALRGGFRPNPQAFMTAIITFDPKDDGTRYAVTVLHSSAEERTRHEEMGFHDGWGQAADQLSLLAQKIHS